MAKRKNIDRRGTNVMLAERELAYLVALLFEVEDAPAGLEQKFESALAGMGQKDKYLRQIDANTKAGHYVKLDDDPVKDQ